MRAPSTRAAPFVLAGFVLAAAIGLALLGRGIATPWILIDELLHAELARGLRSGDGYSVRGHGIAVSWTYPALLAPLAWSYTWMKVLNAVVIVATAVPVYIWGRRLVRPWTSVLAAGLTLLLPSMLFSASLMQENLFLPLFVTACLLCALALERPTLGRQVAALAVIGLAAATRVQGLVLVPVLVLAALTVRRARALWPSLVLCFAVGIAVLTKLFAGGLGVYEAKRTASYSFDSIVTWLVRDAGELSLAVGIVPVAALLALRARDEPERAFLAVSGWATAALVLLAAVAATWEPPGIKERYMAYAMPLLLLALVLWLERGAPHPVWAVAAPAAFAVALPLGRLFREPALLGNGWGLLPFERAGLTAARVLVVGGAAAAVALFLLAPRFAVASVAVFLAVSTAVVYSTMRNQSRAVLALSGLDNRDWLDDAGVRDVAYVNATNFEQEARVGRWFEEWVPVWETEFWNHATFDVLSLGDPEPAPFFQRNRALDWRTGRIGGATPFALTDPRFTVAGTEIARNARLVLWRVSPPLRFATATEGVFADGTMAGRKCAFTVWSRITSVVVTSSRPARIRFGSFVPAAGGGARLTRSVVVTSRGDRAAVLGQPPFRIEVAATPGTRVSFTPA